MREAKACNALLLQVAVDSFRAQIPFLAVRARRPPSTKIRTSS